MEPCPPSRRCWRRVPSPSSWPLTLDDPTAPSSRSTPWRPWPRSWRRSWASQSRSAPTASGLRWRPPARTQRPAA
ncbi:unnamed protein product [Symbiodinium sp. CCMP2456]|nr:unnamed protein product [Symbiodinium sp. CCMP2456]